MSFVLVTGFPTRGCHWAGAAIPEARQGGPDEE